MYTAAKRTLALLEKSGLDFCFNCMRYCPVCGTEVIQVSGGAVCANVEHGFISDEDLRLVYHFRVGDEVGGKHRSGAPRYCSACLKKLF